MYVDSVVVWPLMYISVLCDQLDILYPQELPKRLTFSLDTTKSKLQLQATNLNHKLPHCLQANKLL